ncbi:MAG: HAD family hydrolase [Myxococcales bacterium]|nr:HAD family hydrolase [Myxococcales bacterium]
MRHEDAGTSTRVAAFFDMDQTVVAANTAAIYIEDMRRRGELRKRDLIELWGVLFGYKLALIDMTSVMERVFRGLAGTSEAALAERCQTLFDAKIVHLVSPAARLAIDDHRRRGDVVVLLTAQTPYLARPLARTVGIEHVLCTELQTRDGLFTGAVKGEVCYGSGKTRIARAWSERNGVSIQSSYFYTDSYSDLPMLEVVGHPRAANPDLRLGWHARSRGWKVLQFGSGEA